jgi:hypothetical protein
MAGTVVRKLYGEIAIRDKGSAALSSFNTKMNKGALATGAVDAKVGGLERSTAKFGTTNTAVLLWKRYKRYRDEDALNTLAYYNLEDAVNLEPLMRYVYNSFAQNLGLKQYLLGEKPLPEIDGGYSGSALKKILSHKYYEHKREKMRTKERREYD